jgi:periplasmic protein TonB
VASYLLPLERDRPPLRRRLSGLAAALGVNLLLLLALLRMGIIDLPQPKATESTIVDLLPADSKPTAAPRATPAKAKNAAKNPIAPRKRPPVPEKPKIPNLSPVPLLAMSKDELAAADISNIAKAAEARGEGDSETVGRGPNGELLYAAEWAREPTDAELSGYIPKNAPNGSGLVACKTIPGNRVDDCIELGNDPPGSHLASAVRQAAWQFRVRPPRKGGRELVGSWVRIRIDYYRSGG